MGPGNNLNASNLNVSVPGLGRVIPAAGALHRLPLPGPLFPSPVVGSLDSQSYYLLS